MNHITLVHSLNHDFTWNIYQKSFFFKEYVHKLICEASSFFLWFFRVRGIHCKISSEVQRIYIERPYENYKETFPGFEIEQSSKIEAFNERIHFWLESWLIIVKRDAVRTDEGGGVWGGKGRAGTRGEQEADIIQMPVFVKQN